MLYFAGTKKISYRFLYQTGGKTSFNMNNRNEMLIKQSFAQDFLQTVVLQRKINFLRRKVIKILSLLHFVNLKQWSELFQFFMIAKWYTYLTSTEQRQICIGFCLRYPRPKKLAYRIYSNKRRIWDKKVNDRRPRISTAPPMFSPLIFSLSLSWNSRFFSPREFLS